MMNHNFSITNCDTDSISFRKEDESPYTEQELKALIEEINGLLPEMINYEDDGYYSAVIVLKAKNYILKNARNGKVKIKGSALIDSKKEPALTEMLKTMINDMLDNKGKNLLTIYHKYVKEANDIKDIKRWAVKKNISKAVLNPDRSNEQKVLDALNGKNVQEGDKVFLFSDIDGKIQAKKKGELDFYKNGEPRMIDNRILRMAEDWIGSYDKEHYIERVYKTVSILESVVNMDEFINYSLAKHFNKLKEGLLTL